MKALRLFLRMLFGVLLLMPVAGSFGFMPEPTADMYATSVAWNYISALMNTGYMMPMIGVLCLVSSVLLFINKTALAAALLAPFTVNVITFHWFLDPSPISAQAIPAYILLVLNAYFLWVNRSVYRGLWA